jgi:tripartite-type tricarboxylate transporter receptor subunit TctC
MPRYPQIPTLKEKGYDFEVISITVVYAPAKTPKDRVALLSKVFREASDTDVVKGMLKKFGVELELYDSDELVRIIKKDFAVNKVLMKELGLGIFKGN